MGYDDQPYDVVIVGSGVSGLQALRECLGHGLRVRVLEKESRPGGKWNGHGIYNCVQIQQHKDDFFLPGVPWPEGTPAFATPELTDTSQLTGTGHSLGGWKQLGVIKFKYALHALQMGLVDVAVGFKALSWFLQ